MVDLEDRRNAFLYRRLRDDRCDPHDEWARRNGLLMNTFLVMNALFCSREGMTRREISKTVHHSKQAVSLIVKNLLRDGYVALEEGPTDRLSKTIRMADAGRERTGTGSQRSPTASSPTCTARTWYPSTRTST